MIKLLHIADVHLDTTFLSRSDEVRQRLLEATRESFRRAIDCAVDESVDAVLIAGDLFDGQRLSFSSERFLLEQLFRLEEAEISCFYVSGNHDPYDVSPLQRLNLPSSFVHFGPDEPETVDLLLEGQRKAVIVGQSHATDRTSENLVEQFPSVDSDVPTIGLVHALVTSASSADQHDRYAPCSVEDFRDRKYAYWALGHVHEQQRVLGDPPVYYPGNLQGRTPRERGERGGLLVTLDGAGCAVEFRPFHSVEWRDVTVGGLEEVQDAAMLEHRIRSRVHGDSDSRIPIQDHMVRVTLTGTSPLAENLLNEDYLDDLRSDLLPRLGVLDLEVNTRDVLPPVDLESYRSDQHVLGEVLSLLETLEQDPDQLDEFKPNPLAGHDPGEEDRSTYLRGLLEGLESEAVVRLIIEEQRTDVH